MVPEETGASVEFRASVVSVVATIQPSFVLSLVARVVPVVLAVTEVAEAAAAVEPVMGSLCPDRAQRTSLSSRVAILLYPAVREEVAAREAFPWGTRVFPETRVRTARAIYD